MIVREARPGDVEPILALGRALHEASPRAHLTFDDDGAREALAKCGNSPRHSAFVAEHQGKVVGLLVASEHRWPHIKGRFVTDVVFFSDRAGAGRRLIDRLVEWGKSRGADEVVCAVSFGGKSAEGAKAVFTRAGFEHRGGMFAMNLKGRE